MYDCTGWGGGYDCIRGGGYDCTGDRDMIVKEIGIRGLGI